MGEFLQVWHGSVDLGALLETVGSWHVGCVNHREKEEAVALLESKGWIGRRMHYAPAIPEGIAAFEITDEGIDQLMEWGRNAPHAQQTRQWYRDHSSAPIETPST